MTSSIIFKDFARKFFWQLSVRISKGWQYFSAAGHVFQNFCRRFTQTLCSTKILIRRRFFINTQLQHGGFRFQNFTKNLSGWIFVDPSSWKFFLGSFHLRCNFNYFAWSYSRSSCPEVFCKKGVLRNFINSQENTCYRVSFLISCRLETCNFIKIENLVQLFSCEFCEISKNTFFMEHLWWLLLLLHFCHILYLFCSWWGKNNT